MTELEQLISACDAIIDTYQAEDHPLPVIMKLRKDLAVYGYRISAYVKQVHGQAGLTYLQRKVAIAKYIVDARNLDAKRAMNIMEVEAQSIPSVVDAQREEIMAEAGKEALKSKLSFIQAVLSSMTQDISILSKEQQQANYQGA